MRCEERLGALLRAQVEAGHGVVLEPPLWGMHVSVVSGEQPPLEDRWGVRDGEQVTFSLLPGPRRQGQFWWVDVECPDLLDLRVALGLPRDPGRPLHMTIGRASKQVQSSKFKGQG